jgi:hypothetical protein
MKFEHRGANLTRNWAIATVHTSAQLESMGETGGRLTGVSLAVFFYHWRSVHSVNSSPSLVPQWPLATVTVVVISRGPIRTRARYG